MDRFSILKSSIQQEHSQDFSRGTYNFQDILFKISHRFPKNACVGGYIKEGQSRRPFTDKNRQFF